MPSSETTPRSGTPDQVWDADTIWLLLALGQHTIHDRDAVYDVCEWHHLEHDHEVDVLGYQQPDGSWLWHAEFVVGTRYETERGLRWDTGGQGILWVEADQYPKIGETVTRWLNALSQVRSGHPIVEPPTTGRYMFTGNALLAGR